MAKSIIAMMEKNQLAAQEKQSTQTVENSKSPNAELKKRISLLHVAMEYGMPGIPESIAVGGIGSVVHSLCQAQKEHPDIIDARVVIPFYEALHQNLTNFEEIREISHLYNNQIVKSMVLKKTTDQGVIQYLIKPLDRIGINLFNDVHIPEMIYSDGWNGSKFIERISYFASAVAEFSCAGESLFKPSIVQGHGWATSFLGKLIKQRRIENNQKTPYTVYVAHSIHDGDGVFGYNEVPDIGIKRTIGTPVRLTTDIIDNGYDHIVYVSEQLLKESILNPNQETISNLVLEAYRSSKTSAILNNISTEKFDPSKCLPDEFKFNLDDISSGKEKIKNHLNNGILKEKGKAINLYAPTVLYVGRYSDEKGIEKFDSAIQVILKNKGTFIAMGAGDPLIIQSLMDKYKHEKSVIFFTTKEEQQAHGALIRSAADIFLIPSKIESCGLVPMEANTAGAIAVASRIGGLINVVIPDANGALFEFDINLEEVLHNVLESFMELKRTGNLNIVLKLIQESAVKSFDWNSKHAGSTFAYFNLYRQLTNEQEIKKKLIEQETISTHALLTKNEARVNSILQTENPIYFLPNKIGLTPSELASRMHRPDIAEKINKITYTAPIKKPQTEPVIYQKKRIALNACLEYNQVKLGGVGMFITSFVNSINVNKESHTECQVIMPHYPWHDELIQSNLINKKSQYEVTHLYENRMIQSVVTKVKNNGVIQYLIKPKDDTLYQELYQSVTKNESNSIFHNITPKISYFNSAVSAFVAQSGLRFNIILAHGWGCSLIARLLKEREKFNKTKTIQVVHSEISEQGIVFKGDDNFNSLNSIGLSFDNDQHISPLKEGVLHSDKTVYVSETLLNQAINYLGHFNFNEIVREHDRQGKLVGILNGINDDFHPSKLTSQGEGWDSEHKISINKFIAKQKVCNLISQTLLSNDNYIKDKLFLHNKKLDPEKIWTLFVGRFSEEKGIDRLEEAIECTLQNNGVFIIMGLYGGGLEDLIIRSLSEKYKENPNVIILHEKSYDIQKKYGPLIRFATDITFIPSHKESAGLVSPEAQLNSNFVVSSNIGGLNDTVISYKTGLKYDDSNPKSCESMMQAITEANRFILDLKINKHDDYERFLENLYQASMEKYLFSSPNGPTKRYLDVFDSLCYFYPRKVDEELKAHTTGEYGQKLIEGKFLNPEHRIQTHWGDMVSLYDEKENESELKNSYLKFSPNDTDETFSIGKIDNSEKYCEKIGKFVAVKKQNLNQLSQQQIDKIISEFEILHKMEYLELPRPHITETGEIYFFIKLYKGNPLISSLNAPTTIGLSQKLNYVEQLMMNLRCMHDKNILHLNITEENIVFEEKTDSYRKSMNARLIDFRESQIIPQGKDRVELNHFMENAPVEALAKHASVATDVYGLGLFIFKYLFSPDATCFLNTSPIQGIRDDLNYTAVSNFDKETKLTSKENYILQEMKKMILGMIATNESSRLPLDYCISQIQRFNHILSLPSQLPEFSLEEYCRIAGFQSFDLENPNILKHACEQNYFEIVKIILSDSNRKFYLLGSESNNLELLKKIIQHSDLELIKLLLTHGFFDWITVDGIFDLIHNTEETRNEKQRIFGLFFVYLYSKEHEFNFKDLKKHNNEGHTPLSKLMTIEPWDERSELLFNQLVIHGADINQKTLYDFDALFFLRNNVTIKNKSEVFKKLIKNGFLINEEHLKDKESPHDRFYLQIKTMHFIQSNKISGRNPSSLCFKSKHTALTLAAEFADNDMITCLLEFYMQESPDKDKSLILNQKNKSGETPLHTAILNKNFSTAYLLVINGADIHITDAIGNTAIDLIKNHTDTEDSMKLLNDINRHFQSKFYSIKIGNVVDKLLYYFHEKNFSALYLSYLNNESKLTAAMKNNFLKSIEKLNPTQSEIIQLINMGFSLSNIDETGSSFLNWIENKNQYLSKNLFLKELDLLNREGFNLYDINSINYMGHTPLSYAVFIQDINLIKTFIKEFKAEINAKNGAGNTALHLAVDTRNVEIINLLLSFGGDLTALNNNGLSPENLAWGNEFPEITQCFDNFKKNKKRIFLDPLQTKDDEHMETKRRRIT